MSSMTERATAEKRDNQMDSDDENSQNTNNSRSRSRENVNRKKTKKSCVQFSSDSESEFTERPSSKNFRTVTKVSNKRQQSKNVVSDDDTLSDTEKKWIIGYKGLKSRKIGPKSSKNPPQLSLQKKNTKTTYYTLARSDSGGSEKEFSKHKMFDSFVFLKRISEAGNDNAGTTSKDNKRLTKNASFLLKNNLQKLFQDLKILSNKLMNDIEHTRKSYYYKEDLQTSDAAKAMVECKNIIRTLKEKTNDCERLLVNRHNTWCQKTKNKNIFIDLDEFNTSKKQECPIDRKTVSASSSSDESNKNFTANRKTSTVESDSYVNGQKKALSDVSDFDGKEIFSAEEEENEENSRDSSISTNVENNKQKNIEKKTKFNNKQKETQKGRSDADSSDSDKTIVEENNHAKKYKEKQVKKDLSDQEENQDNERNSSPNVLNQSGDLFLDSDEDERGNQLDSGNEDQASNELSSSKNSKKTDESSINKDHEENQDNVMSLSKNKKADPKRKNSTCLNDQDGALEEEARENLLRSSSDSESNDTKNNSKAEKKLSQVSISKRKRLEDEKAKRTLLDSSSDSEPNNEDAANTKKKSSKSSDSKPHDAEDDDKTKKKLPRASSDSESNDVEDADKIKKKLSKASNSERKKLEEDEEAKEQLLDSSSDSDTKTSKSLSGSEKDKLEEDETTKKSLLDSSSDSELNDTEDVNKTKRKLSESSNSERKKFKEEEKAKKTLLDSSSDSEPNDAEDADKTKKKSSESSDSEPHDAEDDDKTKKKLSGTSSDSESNDVEDADKIKKKSSKSSDSEPHDAEDDDKMKKKLSGTSSDSESNDVEDADKIKKKSSKSSDSEPHDAEDDDKTKKKLPRASSDSESNDVEDADKTKKKSSKASNSERKKLEEDEKAKKQLLDSSSDSDADDSKANKKSSKPSLDSKKKKLEQDEKAKKALLDSSSDSEPNDVEDDGKADEKSSKSTSDSEKNEVEENLKDKNNRNVDKGSTHSSSDLIEDDSEMTDKENENQNLSDSTLNATKEASETNNKKDIDENLSGSTSDVDAENPGGDEINNHSDSDNNDSDEQKAKTDLLQSSSDSDQDERENDANINDSNENNDHQTKEKRTLRSRKNTAKESNPNKKVSENISNKNKSKNRKKTIRFADDIDKEINSDKDLDESEKRMTLSSSEETNDDSFHTKRKSTDSDSDNGDDTKKIKKKFSIKNNKYYKNDIKLRMKSFVKIRRLRKKVLARHLKALQLSKDYLEAKQINSLLTLDNLEKKHTHQPSLSDGEESSSKISKKKQKNLPEETLLDHLNKVNSENNDQNSDSDSSGTEFKAKSIKNSKLESVIEQADQLSKAKLLESSNSEADDAVDKNTSDTADDKSKKKSKKTKGNTPKKNNKENDDGSDDSNDKNSDENEKKSWKQSKLLTSKFVETDSEEENEKTQKRLEKRSKKKTDSDSDKDKPNKAKNKKKRFKRRRILGSDDSDVKISDSSNSDSDSDVEKNDNSRNKKGNDKKTTKRRKKSDSDSDSGKEKNTKSKRRRIRAVANDSDSSDDEHQGSQTSGPKGSGRKNIRKVMKDKQVAQDTIEANKQEEERLKRMAERQKLYNEMYETRLANEEKVDKLILDFDEESKEILLDVDEKLVKRLKPHQAKGIKFMWDACFESLERVQSTPGSGCILAHCMGLGKSFQVVTLAHTLLTHSEKTDINTVLVVAPLSTVLNWMNEFKIWLSEVENGDDIELYELTKARTTMERKCQLENWQRTGGVLIIGYEMFRNLCAIKGKVRKSVQEAILKCILDPGPDLIICDEGHLLKNEDTAISKAIRKVRTLRRVVLTGTPLQNNLIEYHCMVQFVKPNLLGTKKEFSNRFVNPIQNGQFDDSTEYDVKIMKRRAHVLHKMLEGSVQRFDYSVLTPFLPPKQEYVISVKLTEVQCQMYQYYLDNLARRQTRVGGSLFADFQGLYRIWTHPYVMKLHAINNERIQMKKREAASDSEGSLKDFIDDGSDSESSSEESDNSDKSDDVAIDNQSKKPIKRSTRANPVEDEVQEVPEEETEHKEWWSEYVKPEHYDDVRVSAKLLILLDILKEAEQIGDKVLVFSQSLYSLSLIEKFLGMIDDETQNGNELETLDKHSGSWCLGLDYFRFDGQTSAENRTSWVKNFNKPSNTRARLFLISTRAGGLGINLTAANRVVIFDASWNPSHDVQSIFRIYRFGQKKPCYVYRLLAAGTMEEKIYNRQVTKLSLSCRVVDEQQIERHYSNHDLAELYRLEPPKKEQAVLALPKDRLLAEIFLRHKDAVENYHEHDSLLENIAEEELNDEERKQAWQEYEEEKAGKRQMPVGMIYNQYNPQLMLYNNQMMDPMNLNNPIQQGEHGKLLEMIKKDYPNLSEAAQREMAYKALNNMYNYVETQFAMQTANTANLPTMNIPNNSGATFANMLAQNEYTRVHNQLNHQQLQQFQYAQKYGNTVFNLPNQTVRPATSTAAYTANDDEVMEITPSNRGNSEKSQEE